MSVVTVVVAENLLLQCLYRGNWIDLAGGRGGGGGGYVDSAPCFVFILVPQDRGSPQSGVLRPDAWQPAGHGLCFSGSAAFSLHFYLSVSEESSRIYVLSAFLPSPSQSSPSQSAQWHRLYILPSLPNGRSFQWHRLHSSCLPFPC